MTAFRLALVATLGLLTLPSFLHGEDSTDRSPQTYTVEVIIDEVNETGKRNTLLLRRETFGVRDQPLIDHEGLSRIERGSKQGVEFTPYGFEIRCRAEPWGRDRVAFTALIKGVAWVTIHEPVLGSAIRTEPESALQTSKLLRQGQSLVMELPRGDLFRGAGDVKGRFIFRFRLREILAGSDDRVAQPVEESEVEQPSPKMFQLDCVIRDCQPDGKTKILGDPRFCTLNGHSACFLAGPEAMPFLDDYSKSFDLYGLKVLFLINSRDNGRVRLETEVSYTWKDRAARDEVSRARSTQVRQVKVLPVGQKTRLKVPKKDGTGGHFLVTVCVQDIIPQ